jgi:hypothetical protein
MTSTVSELGGTLVPSGRTNRLGEQIKKSKFVLDYQNARNRVGVSDRMPSYHSLLRRSFKWHGEVAIMNTLLVLL